MTAALNKMMDKENSDHFIRLSPSSKSKMKSFPGKIAFKIFSPNCDGSGNGTRNSQQSIKGVNCKSGHGVLKAKRRTLATLQPSATLSGKVVGVSRSDEITALKKHLNETKTTLETSINRNETQLARQGVLEAPSLRETPTTSQESRHFEEDEHSTDSEHCSDDNDTLVKNALKLVEFNPSPVEYWKELAEQRRLALEEALAENEQLYDDADHLKEKIKKLEKEVSEGQYFKFMYNKLLEEKELLLKDNTAS